MIKATIPEIHYGYAGTPTITASVSEMMCTAANGLAGKDIQWAMRIES